MIEELYKNITVVGFLKVSFCHKNRYLFGNNASGFYDVGF